MPRIPEPSSTLPWDRYWTPRGARSESRTGGFLEDPDGLYGKHLNPQATKLPDIIPKAGLLVLCGEPGMGKTTELELLRKRLEEDTIENPSLVHAKARFFSTFFELKNFIENSSAWATWKSGEGSLSILLDGVDEGLIRMPDLVPLLESFLTGKPVERLLLVLTCRSFEWPETEGWQLASLWKRQDDSPFVFELEPLRSMDASIAAEQKGHNGTKFLEAVHRADVAALASRPITLFFLIAEFSGDAFRVSSRRQLYQNGCRRLCEETNDKRTELLRRSPGLECSADDRHRAAKKLACALLLGGRGAILPPTSYYSNSKDDNFLHSRDLIDANLSDHIVISSTLGTGLFTPTGGDGFGFAHQTFTECLAGQELSRMTLPQLRTLLCAFHPGTGNEYVIPQLAELAAWVAGDHPDLFSHLIHIDPATLSRAGVSTASQEEKSKLLERLFTLAKKNEFFDESEYWRFWRDLNHPGLPDQLEARLSNPTEHLMVRSIAIDVAEECRRVELVPILFQMLRRQSDDDRYLRSSIAKALCASMPDERLGELVPLARGEVCPDPDLSIIGHALQRLVPRHWSVADVLPLIGRTEGSGHIGSYWRALHDHLPDHLQDSDILPALRFIRRKPQSFSGMGFRRNFSMAVLRRGLELIDEPSICKELVKLWRTKTTHFREFFRSGDRDDSDFSNIHDDYRRKWIAAIIDSSKGPMDDSLNFLTTEEYHLLKSNDFGWLLKSVREAVGQTAKSWAKVIGWEIWRDKIRSLWWDDFIEAYRQVPVLREQFEWLEEASTETPIRRREKARWLWRQRRFERLRDKRRGLDPQTEIRRSLDCIHEGKSQAFVDLCWALALGDGGHHGWHLPHDMSEYPGWARISEAEKEFTVNAARTFLSEWSDGWGEFGARTTYSDPGVVAIWLLRHEIENSDILQVAVASKWIHAILGIWDSSSDHAKELFALAYRLDPRRVIEGWMPEIRRNHRHPFAIRRAQLCFDRRIEGELVEFIKTIEDPEGIRRSLSELKDLNKSSASDLAAHLLRRTLGSRQWREPLVEELIVAGVESGSRDAWRQAFPHLASHPEMARRIVLQISDGPDFGEAHFCSALRVDEIGDLYLLLCRLFPPSEDPPTQSGPVTPRRSVAHFRRNVLNSLSSRATMPACAQLIRLADALPDQSIWLRRRYKSTLSSVRRNEWLPSPLPDVFAMLSNSRKRLVRGDTDLMNLVLESLELLQLHLNGLPLPAVEDLWSWEGKGQNRKNFRSKDEEAVSDYVARWLRDEIGKESGVVANREIKVVVHREDQPKRGRRTDILVQAWRDSREANRSEAPLSVTIEVKGCWNPEIKTGAEHQLLDKYLRPFGRTHGVFLAAWFFSPNFKRLGPGEGSHLRVGSLAEAKKLLAGFIQPARAPGFHVEPFVLECRLA